MLTPNPHDSLFKYVFSEPGEAAALLEGILATGVVQQIKLTEIAPVAGSFVDEELAARHSDILFEVPLASGCGTAFIYLLMEHQSTPEPGMAGRLLGYLMRIWERFSREQETHLLPPVLPVVVYHGSHTWNAARRMHDQLTVPASELGDLAVHVPGFSYVLHDLSKFGDEELRGRALGRLALYLMRHAFEGRLWERFPEWVDLLAKVMTETGLGAVEAALRYTLSMEKEMPPEETRRLLEQKLGERGTEAMMTAGERLVEKGRAEGRTEGRAEGRAEGQVGAVRSLVLRLMQRRFRTVPPGVRKRIEATDDASKLEQCAERILDAKSIAEIVEDL